MATEFRFGASLSHRGDRLALALPNEGKEKGKEKQILKEQKEGEKERVSKELMKRACSGMKEESAQEEAKKEKRKEKNWKEKREKKENPDPPPIYGRKIERSSRESQERGIGRGGNFVPSSRFWACCS